jgi:heterodisulfide reductase subunit A
MAQLDKTFPTLDCSSCILTPRMADVARHANIDLMTYSEVVSVEPLDWPTTQRADGSPALLEATEERNRPSAFRARIRRKARFVDAAKCTGCGLCATACRMKGRVTSRFDAGLARRSAVYVPFPQAVPLQYTVDPTACLYLTRGACGKTLLCADACPAGAIDFEETETLVDREVGAIIVATGFHLMDPRLKPEYGYGVYPGVLTGIEFERLSSASGPTKGEITVNGSTPRDIVFIKCVGSRDPHSGVPYCSRVCCMATAKHAHLVRHSLPDARITVFYMDVRAYGKGHEEFYDRVRYEGVIYRRGEPAEIYSRDGRLVVLAEDTLQAKPIEVEADLVVLATAIVPRPDAPSLANTLGVGLSPDGFFQEADAKYRPVETLVDGIFLAGCCQGPKDISDTVAHAKAAAASAILALSQSERAWQQGKGLGVQC